MHFKCFSPSKIKIFLCRPTMVADIFPHFKLAEVTCSFWVRACTYDMLSCNISNYPVKCSSERYIIIGLIDMKISILILIHSGKHWKKLNSLPRSTILGDF